MSDILRDVVWIGGAALESEDKKLIAAGKRHGKLLSLLTMQSERVCQFIVWRALLDTYDAVIEKNCNGYMVDLVITAADADNLFEMKFWRSENAHDIESEITRIQGFPSGGFLLVFAGNPPSITKPNLEMIGRLPGIGGEARDYRFQSKSEWNDASEFWMAGWPVPPKARALQQG